MTDPTTNEASQIQNGESSMWRDVWRRFRAHRPAVISLFVLGLIVLAILIGPEILPYGPRETDDTAQDQAPSFGHLLGTDELGRDQLARILAGGRLTYATAGAAVLVAIVVGVAVGITAGYLGGWVDMVLMRLTDVFYAMPGLFVVILLVALVGPGYLTIVVSISLFSWMNTARLVRASGLALKQKEFVEAARASGVPGTRIAVRHVIPNALTPVIVTATLGLALAILVESALSFLGLGFQPPQATWGGMLEQSQRAVMLEGQWWRGLFPGLMIFVSVLCANFVGDGLRDSFDPRQVKR